MASIAEVVTAATDSSTPTVTVTDVQSGDVIVLAEVTYIAVTAAGSVDGLGATWTLAESHLGQAGGRLWVGVGATGAGDISLTGVEASSWRTLRAFVVRDTSSMFVTTSDWHSGSNESVASAPAAAGQAVVALGVSNSSGTSYALNSVTPAGGWASRAAFMGQAATNYRLPTEDPAVVHEATSYRVGLNSKSAFLAVIGGVPATPEGAATLEHEWVTSATGASPRFGTATASHEWATTATGDDTEPAKGTATLSHSWTVTAVGDDTEPNYGTATLTHSWATTAAGENGEVQSGTATLTHSWTTEATGDNGETTLIGWTADHSQQVVFDVTGPDTNPAGPLLVDRAPMPAPAEVTERPILLHSPQPGVADFTVSAGGSVHAKGQWPITEGIVGVPHIWVDGVDITYLRDVPVILDDIAASEPFGWESATLTLPQVSAWETLGAGDLSWMRPDAQVEAWIVDPSGVKVAELFSGHLVSDGARATSSETATVWDVAGDMGAAAYYLHRPPIQMKPTDLGTLIPAALNSVVSRRYGTVGAVTTGIESSNRGSGDDYVSERVSELLASAWTDAGEQWTIARSGHRSYALRLKDTTTAHWTIVPGTPGIDIRLDADHASRSDAIMGRGIGPDGYAWSGRHWPALLAYDPPDYPNTSAGNTIMPGESDADTDSGDGVSVWEQRTHDLGYDIAVDGFLSAADSQVVRDIQAKMGLTVDGIIGPQTWTGTWEVGVDSAALESIRLPLAWRPEVEPDLYGAQGNVTGPNADYDPRVVRRERAIDYGPQVRKAEGIKSARREVNRSQDPGWFGEVTLAVDPMEGSRFLIDEGENIVVKGWRGTDRLCHIAKVRRDLGGGTVTLTIDTKARDAMDLASLRRRDREAQIDPARRPGNVNRKSRQSHDLRTVFEGDSPAGRVHRRALFAGLWSVFPVPISEAGNIVKLDVQAESPATVFSLGFFAAPVQPSHLLRLVGNPQAGSEAWRTRLPELEDHGFIEAWGAGESMAGHWPSQEGPVTGKLRDTGGWSYYSNHGGWVWVAAWSPVSTFIKGRVYPAPID